MYYLIFTAVPVDGLASYRFMACIYQVVQFHPHERKELDQKYIGAILQFVILLPLVLRLSSVVR